MATKYSIAEQVMLMLEAGHPSAAANVKIGDIIVAVGQKINELLKLEYFTASLPLGETIPEGVLFTIYENIPVKRYGTKSMAELPIMPVRLIRNMGVFKLWATETENIPKEQLTLLAENGDNLLTEDGQVILI